jgi:hypothetical protein
LDFGHWDIPAYAIEQIIRGTFIRRLISSPASLQSSSSSGRKLFVIEGLQMLLPNPGRGQSFNKAQGIWVLRVRDEILNEGKTIIAVTHSPKIIDDFKPMLSKTTEDGLKAR